MFSYLSHHAERIDEPQVDYLSLQRAHVAGGRSIDSSWVSSMVQPPELEAPSPVDCG